MQLRNCTVSGHCSSLVLSASTLQLTDLNRRSCFKIYRNKHLTPQFVENAEHQNKNSLTSSVWEGQLIHSSLPVQYLKLVASVSLRLSPTSRLKKKKKEKKDYFKCWNCYSAGEKKAWINSTFQRHTLKNLIKMKPNLDGIRYTEYLIKQYHSQL